jgi:glycosyltransferase involved in cell wall biosynthesis
MKRVLFIPHSSEPSGAPRVTVDLARRFADRGWDIRVALPMNDGVAGLVHQANLPYTVLGYPAGSFAASGMMDRLRLALGRLMGLGRLWIHLMRLRPEVAWIGSSVALPFLLTCRAAGVRTIVHVHESPEMSAGHPWRIRLVRQLAHGIVFVGREPRRPFEPKPRGRVWKSLSNPMDPSLPIGNQGRAALRASLGASVEEAVFICAAFLSPRKNHELLLRAFARASRVAPAIRLWIVGGEVAGHEGLRNRLQSLAQDLGIAERVCFTGQREDVPTLLQAAEVCVLASQAEAMPLSIAEAQFAGIPIIATRVGDIPTMVPDGRCGLLVDPGDEDALADSMILLATEPELRRQFGARGRARAKELYEDDALIPQFAEIIRRVTAA